MNNRRLRFLSGLILLVVMTFVGSGFAAEKQSLEKKQVEYIEVKTIPLYKTFRTKDKWYATAYQANIKYLELSKLPAKLCFNRASNRDNQICFEARATVNNMLYEFQFVEQLEMNTILKDKEPNNIILFIAKFSGGGSGTLRLISIWNYSKNEEMFIKLSPTITISEQGEYKVLREDNTKLNGLLVIADYISEETETHFAPHKYRIVIYQYNVKTNSLNAVSEFETESKYKSLDDTDKIDVIKHEINNIKKHILK